MNGNTSQPSLRQNTAAAPESFPTPWEPKITRAYDTLTGKWSLTINFGMGFPWIATSMQNPFRVATSGPIFESEEAAKNAAAFFEGALSVLLDDPESVPVPAEAGG